MIAERYVEGVTKAPHPEDVVLTRNGGGRLTARFWLEYVGSWEDFCLNHRTIIAIVRHPLSDAPLCPTCDGQRWVQTECPTCDGSGRAPIDTDPVGRPGQAQGDQQWPDTD